MDDLLLGYLLKALDPAEQREVEAHLCTHPEARSRLAVLVKQKLDLYLSSCQLGVTLASLGLGAVTEPAVGAMLRPVLVMLLTLSAVTWLRKVGL